MATNRVYKRADYLGVVPTDPTLPLSGMACRFGERPGVVEAASAAGTAGGTVSVAFVGEYNLSVQAFTTGGTAPSAVALGDILYYTDSGGTAAGVLNKLSTAHRFGYAAGTIASGGTATIPVIVGY
jgi:hypothetical protein